MEKTLVLKTNKGLESMIKVAGTLKRKQIDVQQLILKNTDKEYSNLMITIDENEKQNIKQVILYIKKLYDVYNIEVVKGDH